MINMINLVAHFECI